MFTDFVLNEVSPGGVGQDLVQPGQRFESGLLRPYIGRDGQHYVTINTGRSKYDDKTNTYIPVFEQVRIRDLQANGVESPVFNATSLRKDEWISLDNVVLREARKRLRAWSDLSASSSYGGFNGMGKMILEHETMNDPGEAQVDMDGLAEGRGDSPKFQLEGLPLPITHSDFWFSKRRLTISRNSGTPLDTAMGEAAGRRVAETIEKTLIGVQTGISYGASTDYSRTASVYGYTNYPDRITKTDLTAPDGTNGATIYDEFLAMRELLYADNFYGPFMVYTSSNWDAYLDKIYSSTEPSAGTLRDMLLKIDGIRDIRRLDYMPAATGATFQVIFVQMTSDVARAVNGMDITTVQWESKGGMQLNFKVMAIMVPQLRSTFAGNCGILHGRTAT